MEQILDQIIYLWWERLSWLAKFVLLYLFFGICFTIFLLIGLGKKWSWLIGEKPED